MADYEKIVARYPEMADFIRAQRTIRYRGEVMAYAAKVRAPSFSTDEGGFRHSTLGGKTYSVGECLTSERYGVLIGASNLFGFGVAGNENTMPSLLAERFGFPFANAGLPGGNSRNLYGLMLAFLARAPHPPAVVVHSSGGDLATFCNSSLADPVFGSPNRGQRQGPLKERSLTADAEQQLPHMLAFTSLWTGAIANLCRAYKVPLVLIHQSSVFEKAKLTETEKEMDLGKAIHGWQEREFDKWRRFGAAFYERRTAIAENRRIPLAGRGLGDRLTFIDEFHCDREGTALLSQSVGDAVAELLESSAA